MADANNKRKTDSNSISPVPATKRCTEDQSHPIRQTNPNVQIEDAYSEDEEDYSGDDDDEEDDEFDEEMFGHNYGGIDLDEDEDEDSQEQEVQHITHMIDGHTIDIKCCTFPGCDGDFETWLDTLLVVCSVDGKQIGNGIARYIKRGKIRHTFWESMEAPCDETSWLAFAIFDRYGRLRPEFKEHPVRKGSGVWGSELDEGNILLIEEIRVDRAWRRKGVGKVIPENLNRMGQSGGKEHRPDMADLLREIDIPNLFKPVPHAGRKADFNILCAGLLTSDVKVDCEDKLISEKRRTQCQALSVAVAFYRSIGYRRIGNSSCFALALDQEHPAHKLNSADDFDSVDVPVPDDDDDNGFDPVVVTISEDDYEGGMEARWNPPKFGLEKMQRSLPLHHAITTLPDAECLAFLKTIDMLPTDIKWTDKDMRLKNLLHNAATSLKPRSAQWLLATVDKIHNLSSARNEDGLTPLEAVHESLEVKRTRKGHVMMTIVVSDMFAGFPKEAIAVLLVFRALHNTKVPTTQELACLKFGCTCGECLGGFISPRMCLALKYPGEYHGDMLNGWSDSGEEWMSVYDYVITHIAPDIKQNFRTNKSLRVGYAYLFQRIAACLERKELPTAINVLNRLQTHNDEWPPNTKNYLQRGGKVEDALRIVFEHARDQDYYAGNGDAWNIFKYEFENLKACRNDHEFGFVALLCGLANFS